MFCKKMKYNRLNKTNLQLWLISYGFTPDDANRLITYSFKLALSIFNKAKNYERN